MIPSFDLQELKATSGVKPSAEWKVPHSLEQVNQSPYETIWLRLYAWAILALGVTYYFGIHRLLTEPNAVFNSSIQVTLLIGLSEFVLHILYWRMVNKIVLRYSMRKLQTKVPAEDACPCSIEIYQNSVVTGYDEGYFWIQNDLLYFKGLQSTFRLNASDLEPIKKWPRKQRPNLDAGRPPRFLRLLGSYNPMQIKLDPIDPFEDYGARRRSMKFDKVLAKWISERPNGDTESRIPPEDLHPGLKNTGAIRFEAFYAGCLLCLINLAIIATGHYSALPNNLGGLGYMIPVIAAFVMFAFSLRMVVLNFQCTRFRDELMERTLDFEVNVDRT